MTTATQKLLGEVRLEGHGYEEIEGHGTPNGVFYRPAGIYLQNDGKWHYWMAPGNEYELVRDATGWLVTCFTWAPGHTYRLAANGEYVDSIPLDDGTTVKLDPSRRYLLRPNDGFELHEL